MTAAQAFGDVLAVVGQHWLALFWLAICIAIALPRGLFVYNPTSVERKREEE